MTYFLKNCVIFDALHPGDALEILVDGETILAVGTGLSAPEGAAVRDLGGRMVFPGFIDAHVHVCIGPAYMTDAISAWARHGVATVRDLGMLAPARSTPRAPAASRTRRASSRRTAARTSSPSTARSMRHSPPCAIPRSS